jgi:phosphoribosyl 1,2-cyclic phosphodiesterase
MRIVTFASGSSGNCSLISEGKVNILIDAGISMRRTVASLAGLGLTPQDLCGVLITHEHSDHISGLSMLIKHHNLKVFAPLRLCDELCRLKPDIKNNLNIMPENDKLCFEDVEVNCFKTMHDAAYSVGYRFEGEQTLGFATDTGCINDELLEGLEGTDTALIEANHDLQMLKSGPYPVFLKERILSPRGHLSNDDCGILANYLANHGTRNIILGHLSRDNNTPEMALQTVKAAVTDENVQIFVAPANDMLEVKAGDRLKCLI